MKILLLLFTYGIYRDIPIKREKLDLFSSVDHKWSEDYCHSPGIVAVVVVRKQNFSRTLMDRCYLDLGASFLQLLLKLD